MQGQEMINYWTENLVDAINEEIDEEVLGLEPKAREKFFDDFRQANDN